MLSKIIKGLENCPCGKKHVSLPKTVIVGNGVLEKLPEIITKPP